MIPTDPEHPESDMQTKLLINGKLVEGKGEALKVLARR
jgi:hypothetical protein